MFQKVKKLKSYYSIQEFYEHFKFCVQIQADLVFVILDL